jgi:hypothetical protein
VLTDSAAHILGNGTANDVPVIFGSMAQEIDDAPADNITSYSAAEYISFIQER